MGKYFPVSQHIRVIKILGRYFPVSGLQVQRANYTITPDNIELGKY